MALCQVNLQELKALVVDDSRTSRRAAAHRGASSAICYASSASPRPSRPRTAPTPWQSCGASPPTSSSAICTWHRSTESNSRACCAMQPTARNAYAPVLMMTADATETQLSNALSAGVNSFVSKPVEMAVLRARIVALFSRPMVFVREGRQLRPLRSSCQAEAVPCAPAAPAQPAGAQPANP